MILQPLDVVRALTNECIRLRKLEMPPGIEAEAQVHWLPGVGTLGARVEITYDRLNLPKEGG